GLRHVAPFDAGADALAPRREPEVDEQTDRLANGLPAQPELRTEHGFGRKHGADRICPVLDRARQRVGHDVVARTLRIEQADGAHARARSTIRPTRASSRRQMPSIAARASVSLAAPRYRDRRIALSAISARVRLLPGSPFGVSTRAASVRPSV